MNNEQREQYYQFLQKVISEFDVLKAELAALTKSQCRTYAEVTNFLTKRRKEASWEGKSTSLVLTAIIDGVIKDFASEMESLPIKKEEIK
ncbi:hypothetical protein [Bacillus sp. AG4(2022)]|uniref:hypothetical protein n=1 Tax=Bacillus sp. AG4(2022) TaxID=2962594 RepID=UPI002880C625|nr:hypothetical protein [Bacillus sp. AG4(2022)]MDT0163856.1 hypothetical protein [Bacillus sp. AG4(2022)]